MRLDHVYTPEEIIALLVDDLESLGAENWESCDHSLTIAKMWLEEQS